MGPVPPPVPIQPPQPTMRCPHCSKELQFLPELAGQLVACPECGGHIQMPPNHGSPFQGQASANFSPIRSTALIYPKPNSLDPSLSVLFSILIPGLTQLLLGQTVKGLMIFFVGVILALLTACFGLLLLIPIAAIDGYKLAQKLKNGQPIGDWEFF